MTSPLPRSIRTLLLFALASLLAACASIPPQSGFDPAQIAMLQEQGFVETDDGWQLTMPERLLFRSDKSDLPPEQQQRIIEIASRLVSVGITTARIEGHTDSTGKAAYNLTLSRARAEAVAGPMRSGGMQLTADQVIGRGEALPLSSNATTEGRQDNRRVVVIVSPE